MKCRRLNERGVEAFRAYLESLENDPARPIPHALLTTEETSEPLEDEIEVDDRAFQSRFELGDYLVACLSGVDIQPLLQDEGFWSWLALRWFDQLCPADDSGTRSPAKYNNYILTRNFKHRPRHAVRTSYLLVRKYGEDARFLLCNPLHVRGDLTEQLATRQFLVECDCVIRTASRLYYDKANNWYKRGATSTKRKGNVRRFIRYLQQIELTYDLYSMRTDDLIAILPNEFHAFLSEP